MDDKVLAIDEAGKDRLGNEAWECRGWIEGMMRDAGIPFTPESDEWAKRFASRMAVRREMVRAGLVVEQADGEAWGAIL